MKNLNQLVHLVDQQDGKRRVKRNERGTKQRFHSIGEVIQAQRKSRPQSKVDTEPDQGKPEEQGACSHICAMT